MTTLTLLVVRCQDVESAHRFYAALGLSLTKEQHGAGPVHYSCQLGSTVLELYPTTSATSNVRLGLAVPNLDVALERVRLLGGRIEREPTPESRVAVVRDPDGNALELSQASGAPNEL
jgi:lactoylglutathione lyase